MARAAIYTRLSTDEQVKTSGSLETQEERCRALVAERGDRVVKVFREEGYSGGTLDRPALSELLDYTKAGNCDYICCYDTDRLSRSWAHLGWLEHELEKARIKVVYVNTPTDHIARLVKGLVGEIERIQI